VYPKTQLVFALSKKDEFISRLLGDNRQTFNGIWPPPVSEREVRRNQESALSQAVGRMRESGFYEVDSHSIPVCTEQRARRHQESPSSLFDV